MLVVTVIQMRNAVRLQRSLPELFKVPQWLHWLTITTLRFCMLHSKKAIVYLLFAGIIRPRPQLIDLPSIVLLALALGAPRLGTSKFILLWTQVCVFVCAGW